MFLLIIPVVVFLYAFYRLVIQDSADGRGFGLFLTCVITAFSFIIMFFIGGIACAVMFDMHLVKTAEQTLVAIRDKDGIGGSFFLGSGSIDSKPYYFYYVKLTDGGIRPDRMPINTSITIYEEDRTDAVLIWRKWEYDMQEIRNNSFGYRFAIPMSGNNQVWEFHVPKGTIRTGYSM